MGFGSNPEVVASRADMLDDLKLGRPTVWRTEKTHAATRKLAYQIREALYIASLPENKGLFPELARAYDIFSIHVVEPGRVEARIKPQPIEVTSERGDVAPRTPEHGITDGAFRVVPQVGLSTAQECIDSWNKHQPSSDPLLMQRTTLSLAEKIKLYTWTQNHTPKLMFLEGDDHITLSLFEAEVASLAAWTPPAQAGKPEDFDID